MSQILVSSDIVSHVIQKQAKNKQIKGSRFRQLYKINFYSMHLENKYYAESRCWEKKQQKYACDMKAKIKGMDYEMAIYDQ